jgi:hypothetical protein
VTAEPQIRPAPPPREGAPAEPAAARSPSGDGIVRVRGVARVRIPLAEPLPAPMVRAVAKVPDALSVPRKPPPAWPLIPSTEKRHALPIRAEGADRGHHLVAAESATLDKSAESPTEEREPASELQPSGERASASEQQAAAEREPAGQLHPAGERESAGERRASEEPQSAGESPTAGQGAELAVPPLRAPVPDDRQPGAPLPARRNETPDLVRGDANPVRNKGVLRRLGARAALPAATAAVAAFVVGTGYLAFADRVRRPASDIGRWGAFTASAPAMAESGTGPANAARPPGDPFSGAAATLHGVPSRLRANAVGIDTDLEKLHLAADGTLTPPRTFGKAGWYADGTAPGDTGPAVIAGHVDSKSGPAVFYRLREISAGDRIDIVRGGTVVRFTVTRTAWYPKTKFPTAEVYGPTPDRQLRLITCGGVFDHRLRSYNDNLVVYAVAG